jgi:hypothetical protein
MILESTFTSVTAMAGRFLVPPFLVRDPFDTHKVVREIEKPILILHGRDDEVIPVRHAQRLADAAPEAELVLLPGGHNTPLPYEPYWSAVSAYLDRMGIGAEVGP